MDDSIFRKKSLERINKPEQLDDYIKVTRLGIWMAAGAVLILIGSFTIWIMFGGFYDKLTATGLSTNGNVICFLPTKEILQSTKDVQVKINGKEGSVQGISEIPYSYDEVSEILGNQPELLKVMGVTEWNYMVTIDSDRVGEGFYKVVIQSLNKNIGFQ